MTDTTGLPPGCAKLTFDPNDRATWENKIIVWHDGSSDEARVVDFATDNIIATYGPAAERYAVSFDCLGLTADLNDRLYDAAPEPVKSREWWIVLAPDDLVWTGPHMHKHNAERSIDMACRDDLRLVRLIEGDQA